MKYFHLSKNPYYSAYQKAISETFATCSIEPNVMRHSVSSTYNTSAAKVNVVGGYFGLSTFSIAGKSSVEKVFHGKETMAHVHAAIERPEILESIMRKEEDGGEEFRSNIIKLHSKNKLPNANSKLHTLGSTFMHFLDSYFTWNVLRKEINTVRSDEEDRSDEEGIQFDHLETDSNEHFTRILARNLLFNPIHPCTDEGMLLYDSFSVKECSVIESNNESAKLASDLFSLEHAHSLQMLASQYSSILCDVPKSY